MTATLQAPDPAPSTAGSSTAGPRTAGRERLLSVLGTRHLVSCAHTGIAASVASMWAPFLASPSEVADRGPVTSYAMSSGRLTIDGDTVVTGASAPWLLANFAAALNGRALAGHRGLAVHAGVVCRDGAVVAFPAVSGAGKSTLTAAACAAGFDYVSDEALCLSYDDRGVQPYPKPLALSPWSARAVGLPTWDEGVRLEERLYSPEQIGTRVADGPLRLAHVVLPERGHARANLVELDRAAVLPVLLRNSFNHFRRPAAALELMAAVASGLRLWRLTYGDPREAAELMAARLH